jgi:RNA polymerase sigma-70 factor, ECF subfamily
MTESNVPAAMTPTEDKQCLSKMLELNRSRLKLMIAARLDRRLYGRVDPSDVVQEVNVEAIKRFSEFSQLENLPFITWLRSLAKQKIAEIMRRNMGAQVRDVRREIGGVVRADDESSIILTNYYSQQLASPSSVVSRGELCQLIMDAVVQLGESDRTVILLRHVDQYTAEETAIELGISANTCRQRYLRALRRLKDLLKNQGLRIDEGIS